MTGPQVENAMRHLGDEHRALVELSVVRGIPDEEIGGYLGIDAATVAERRSVALRAVAAECGDGSEEGVAGVVAALTGEPFQPPEPEPAEPRRSKVVPLLLGGVVLVLLLILVISLAGSNDEEGLPSSTAGGASAASPGGRGALEPLAATSSARGTARIATTGSTARLRLSARGLPPPQGSGGYVVWLYDSVTDARALSGALRGTFHVDTPLPGDWRRYRFIDVSREPADGNRNHSGQSVLRVALRSVEAR